MYRSELRQEQLREIEILRLPPREQRLRASKTMQDQVNARTSRRRVTASTETQRHFCSILFASVSAPFCGLIYCSHHFVDSNRFVL